MDLDRFCIREAHEARDNGTRGRNPERLVWLRKQLQKQHHPVLAKQITRVIQHMNRSI